MCNSMPIRNDFSSVNVHITQLNYAADPRTHMHSSGEFFSISKMQRNIKVIYRTTVINVAVQKNIQECTL